MQTFYGVIDCFKPEIIKCNWSLLLLNEHNAIYLIQSTDNVYLSKLKVFIIGPLLHNTMIILLSSNSDRQIECLEKNEVK